MTPGHFREHCATSSRPRRGTRHFIFETPSPVGTQTNTRCIFIFSIICFQVLLNMYVFTYFMYFNSIGRRQVPYPRLSSLNCSPTPLHREGRISVIIVFWLLIDCLFQLRFFDLLIRSIIYLQVHRWNIDILEDVIRYAAIAMLFFR